MIKKLCITLCLICPAVTMSAQQNFFQSWEARATRTQSKQPPAVPPVFAPYVGLIQVFRSDFTRQVSPTHVDTWNYDTSKGFCLIPFANTEVDLNLPPYLSRDPASAASPDGSGDLSFLLKYRAFTGNEKHHNYIVTGTLGSTIPTGSHKNGSTDSTVTPTLALAKGFRKLNIQNTLGSALPLGHTSKLGRPVVWNITGQYHVGKYFWPELEFNSTFFHGGPNDGKIQTFATPGLVVSRFKLRPQDEKSRLGLAFGGGMQIATSKFHSYNHALIFTGRFLF